ncbi:MAG: hypothetical protein HY455_01105 [Parcubacteria group bacterium]|nr:hypothetical protein [Parcubacteria group bacterium]
MFRHTFFYFLFSILLVLAPVHVLGIKHFWFAAYPPLDLVLHFVGGLWIAGMGLWLFFLSGLSKATYRDRIPKVHVVFGALVFALMIGGLWEIFEVINDSTLRGYPNYVFDTLTDLVADTTGALLVAWYFVKKYL